MSAVESASTETPVVETPAVETPVVETPATETPVVETPATETPVVETTASETPVVEAVATEAPAAETAVETTKTTDAPEVAVESTTETTAESVATPVASTDATKTEEETNTPVTEDCAVAEETEIVLTKEEKITKAKEIFVEGKKHYLAGSYDLASEKLSEALKFGVEVFGEFGVENFHNYYYYGKSLLEVGRAEDDVLKTALKDMPLTEENANDSIDEEQYGNPETLSAEEREEIKDQVDEALAENARDLETGKPENAEGTVDAPATETEATTEVTTEVTAETTTETAEKTATDEEQKVEEAVTETKEDAEMETEEGETAPTAEDDNMEEGSAEEDDESEDQPSSIQAAWEILEVARKICDAQEPTKDWELSKADVLLSLGECSVEDENYTQAVDDITVALELYKKYLDTSDRTIARTYVIMARAYKLNDDFLGASEHYIKAKESLSSRIAALDTTEATEEVKASNEKEVAELKELVADIDLKIEDAKESAQQSDENIARIKEQLGLNTASALSEKTDAPAVDITNMVRKGVKRTADSAQTDESKRLKEINAAE